MTDGPGSGSSHKANSKAGGRTDESDFGMSSKKDWESVSLGGNPLCRWFWIMEDVIPYFS